MMLRHSLAVSSGILLSVCVLFAAPPPYQRNEFTTNAPGATVGVPVTFSSLFYVANGLSTPVHPFGSLMLHRTDGSSILNLNPQNAFFTITNYNAITTNLFTGSRAEGTLTNLLAGYYEVSISGNVDSTGAANHFHWHLFTNAVECDVIGWEADNVTGTAQSATGAAAGIFYFPAATQFSLRLANKGATGLATNVHATLTISSP